MNVSMTEDAWRWPKVSSSPDAPKFGSTDDDRAKVVRS
jgi:hypothetical protein